ncbi:hypothetical protein QPK87_24035 [Kamptonema cortianum]|nr:hypothetical protein [Kamptonema cortianum]
MTGTGSGVEVLGCTRDGRAPQTTLPESVSGMKRGDKQSSQHDPHRKQQ